MIIRIIVTTPKGQAAKAEKRLRGWLLGFKRPDQLGYSEEDDSFYWEVTATPRQAVKITRNIGMYDSFIKGVFESKAMRKYAASSVSKEGLAELEHMLKEGTSIRIVKNAEAEELCEDNRTWWTRLKEKFKRNSPS